jgi:hypothetical protein
MGWQENVFPLLIVTASGGFTGLYEYAPTPGLGNLILSVAAAPGTDPYGNAFPAGLAVYDNQGDVINLQNGEILMSSLLGLIRQISPTADLMYTPSAAAGNLSVAIASQAGVDAYGNTFLQGLTATAGQLSGQVIDASVFEGTNFRIDEHGEFLYSPPAAGTTTTTTTTTPVTAVPYLIGSHAVGGGGGTSLVITVATGTTAGDQILVSAASVAAGSQVSAVTDSRANTYTKQSTGTTMPSTEWTSPGTTALQAGDTITLTYGTSAGAKGAIAQGISNLAATPIDNVPAATNGTSTAPSITSAALAQADELVVATLTCANAGGTPSWAAGWTVLLTLHNTGDQVLSVAYKNVTSAAAVTASATIVSAAWSMMMVTYKEQTSTITTTTSAAFVPAPVLAQPPVPYKIGGTTAAAGSTTLVVPVTTATTAGDVIHVAGGAAVNTSDVSSVADSKGNTYVAVGGSFSPPSPDLETFVAGASGTASVALTTSDTVTLTYSLVTGDKAASVTGIPNLPANSFDSDATAGASSVNPNVTLNGLTEITELGIVSVCWTNAGGAITWDAADIPIDQQHSGAGVFLAKAYQAISQPPNSMTASPTIAVSAPWLIAVDAFREV